VPAILFGGNRYSSSRLLYLFCQCFVFWVCELTECRFVGLPFRVQQVCLPRSQYPDGLPLPLDMSRSSIGRQHRAMPPAITCIPCHFCVGLQKNTLSSLLPLLSCGPKPKIGARQGLRSIADQEKGIFVPLILSCNRGELPCKLFWSTKLGVSGVHLGSRSDDLI
jgi:hypothetical protein